MTPVNAQVEVLQGDRAVLEVYAASYPPINGSQIRWYWPNGSEILERDVEFMNGRRSLFLVDVQLSYAGLYRCDVALPGSMETSSAVIDLQVHGMYFQAINVQNIGGHYLIFVTVCNPLC